MFEKPEKADIGELGKRSSARGRVFLLHDRRHHGFAARGFDLLERGLAEAVSVNRQLLGELAVTQKFDLHATTLNQASVTEHGLGHLGAGLELLQVAKVHADNGDRKRAVEAALRQTTLHRSLTTLEVELADVAALASLLAFLTATAGLAEAGAYAATKTLLEVARASGRREMRQNFAAHDFFSCTLTRCSTFLIMPRKDGVFSTTTLEPGPRRPRPSMMRRVGCGRPITLPFCTTSSLLLTTWALRHYRIRSTSHRLPAPTPLIPDSRPRFRRALCRAPWRRLRDPAGPGAPRRSRARRCTCWSSRGTCSRCPECQRIRRPRALRRPR